MGSENCAAAIAALGYEDPPCNDVVTDDSLCSAAPGVGGRGAAAGVAWLVAAAVGWVAMRRLRSRGSSGRG